jgi:hypothetical protein
VGAGERARLAGPPVNEGHHLVWGDVVRVGAQSGYVASQN